MAAPTADEARAIAGWTSTLLADATWTAFLTLATNATTESDDHDLLLFGGLYLFAKSRSTQYATQVGDRSFSALDPQPYLDMYTQRARQLDVTPELVRNRVSLRKVNSELDDETNLNLS